MTLKKAIACALAAALLALTPGLPCYQALGAEFSADAPAEAGAWSLPAGAAENFSGLSPASEILSGAGETQLPARAGEWPSPFLNAASAEPSAEPEASSREEDRPRASVRDEKAAPNAAALEEQAKALPAEKSR
ncbi:MAG: hypothetical protein KGL04_04820, partial [Elusimicrobia bacterium]|nr:hypothetical protein [Elusimicrobiota bacterium]